LVSEATEVIPPKVPPYRAGKNAPDRHRAVRVIKKTPHRTAVVEADAKLDITPIAVSSNVTKQPRKPPANAAARGDASRAATAVTPWSAKRFERSADRFLRDNAVCRAFIVVTSSHRNGCDHLERSLPVCRSN
jgi:hypothetical protein